MASEIPVKQGAAIVWRPNGGDYDIDLGSLPATKARQGEKGDLGALRAPQYCMLVEITMDAAPTAGRTIEFYWSASPDGTAGTQNTGGASGADAVYKNGEEDEWKMQLLLVGALVLTNDGDSVIQIMEFVFSPPLRYGMPVVVNEADQALEEEAGAGESSSGGQPPVVHRISLYPIMPESQ